MHHRFYMVGREPRSGVGCMAGQTDQITIEKGYHLPFPQSRVENSGASHGIDNDKYQICEMLVLHGKIHRGQLALANPQPNCLPVVTVPGLCKGT
jgi:hypothetical protein